jgi:splicing factor U2AF subunit
VLDQIILGLGDLDLGGKKLLAKRACMGVAQAAALDGGVGAISMLAGSTTDKVPETPRVLMLMNMITHDELLDRDTYEGMLHLILTGVPARLTFI